MMSLSVTSKFVVLIVVVAPWTRRSPVTVRLPAAVTVVPLSVTIESTNCSLVLSHFRRFVSEKLGAFLRRSVTSVPPSNEVRPPESSRPSLMNRVLSIDASMVMSAVPSKETPLIVLAVSNAVAVSALPVSAPVNS